MNKEKVWVWFKGGSEGGFWQGGFLASKATESGVIIEKADFVSCRVPEWRVSFSEPNNLGQGPQIPKDAIWKYS